MKNDFRYFFEHQALPQNLFKTPDGVILNILNNPQYILKFYKALAEQNNVECAYTEKDFMVFPNAIKSRFEDGDYWLIEICSPIADEELLCHRIYIAFKILNGEKKAKDVRYFTIEKGIDQLTKEDEMFLGEWTCDGRHLNYGKIKYSNIFQLQIICEIGKISQIYLDRQEYKIIMPVNLKQLESEKDKPVGLGCPRCKCGVCYNQELPKKILFVCPQCHLVYFGEQGLDSSDKGGSIDIHNKTIYKKEV